mmetsp:Transcript_2292/g.3580  ORF Transcript_2292/g.3580 Transcript_2292/m.3580 type:complete len:131 (-) Transcript_2292:695-1087(-)
MLCTIINEKGTHLIMDPLQDMVWANDQKFVYRTSSLKNSSSSFSFVWSSESNVISLLWLTCRCTGGGSCRGAGKSSSSRMYKAATKLSTKSMGSLPNVATNGMIVTRKTSICVLTVVSKKKRIMILIRLL